MKLDTRALRYLTNDDWRVLTAVEQGSKNHEVVPTPLISQIAGLRGGSAVNKCISNLAKANLIGKVKNARYDGYRLTYGGLDYLALNAHRRSNIIYSLGNQIGVGKESDIYVTASPEGRQQVLKLHRLGRISFRTVKANRDYLRKRSTGSWMYLSRLAAQKEHAFMTVLHREGFPVPEPIAWSRHTVVMEFIDSFPLRMVEQVGEPGKLYAELMDLIVQFAKRGLIHGDFNEFNILIREKEVAGKVVSEPIVIDFPQTISTNHENAEFYFDRDVACIKRYFERRFKYTSDESGPHFAEALEGAELERRLDIEVEASGFSKKMGRELSQYVEVVGGDHNDAEFDRSPRDDDEQVTDEDHEGIEHDDVHQDDDDFDAQVGEEPSGCRDFSGQETARISNWESAGSQGFVKPDFGLAPLDIAGDAEISAEKVREKKAAQGWAL